MKHCTYLMNVAWYVADNERPFVDFPKLCSLMGECDVSLPSPYSSDKTCRAFCNILAAEMIQEVKKNVSRSNFMSFLVDGSTVFKRKLSYEGELFYVRTAQELRPKVQLFDFISMKDYVSVSAANLTHAVKATMV